MKYLPAPLRAGLVIALGVVALGGVWMHSQNDVTPVQAAAATESVTLTAGICNNVALTWPAGTSIDTVAAAISPTNSLDAIWRQAIVGDERKFIAWSPLPGAPNDYTATESPLEAAFLCMTAAGTLERPNR
ncbi:MAG: hypothetical protein ACRDJE_09380 [Dehalococcoidia bacterium]